MNTTFYCCGTEFIGAFDKKGKPPHCKICGKYPSGYRRGQLKIKRRSFYVPVALKIKIKQHNNT